MSALASASGAQVPPNHSGGKAFSIGRVEVTSLEPYIFPYGTNKLLSEHLEHVNV
jgi:hypothetical protein